MEKVKIIYKMYRTDEGHEVSAHRACCEQAVSKLPIPAPVEGEVRFSQAQHQLVTTHIV